MTNEINQNKTEERLRNEFVLGSLDNPLKNNLSSKEERIIITGETNETSQVKVKATNATTLNTVENIAKTSSSVPADTVDQSLNFEAQTIKVNVSQREEVESRETAKNIDVPASTIAEANNIIQNEEVNYDVVEASAKTNEAGVSKASAPQAQASKAQTTIVEAPQAKTVKVEAEEIEATKVEVKEVETAIAEVSKVEAVEVETATVEVSKAEAVEVETATVVEAQKAQVTEETGINFVSNIPLPPASPTNSSKSFKIVKNPRSEKSKAILGDGTSTGGKFLNQKELEEKIAKLKAKAEVGALESMGSKIDQTAQTEIKKAPVNAVPLKFDENGIPIAPALPVFTTSKPSSIKKTAFSGNEKPINTIDLNQLKAKIEARKVAIEAAARKEAEAKVKAEEEAKTQKAIEEKARQDAEFAARKAAEAKEAADLAAAAKAQREAEVKAKAEEEAKKIAEATGEDVNTVLAQNEASKVERAKTTFKNFTKKVIAAKNFGGSLLDAIQKGITLKTVSEEEKEARVKEKAEALEKSKIENAPIEMQALFNIADKFIAQASRYEDDDVDLAGDNDDDSWDD